MPQANGRPLIFHADDLGLAKAFNEGIREAHKKGFLTSASLRTNGSAFEEAVGEVMADSPTLGVGVHLNVVEGRSQRSNVGRRSRICDSTGRYRVSFPSLLRAHLVRDRTTLDEIEEDFRHQMDMVLARGVSPDHLSTHQHSHAIPSIFEIVCRMAVEYKVPFVRLVREPFYLDGPVASHLGAWFPTNLMKHFLLNAFSEKNASIARGLGVRTNAYFVGVIYTGRMSGTRIRQGLAALPPDRAGPVEVLLHPCKLVEGQDDRYIAPYLEGYVKDTARDVELSALLDGELFRLTQVDGWELTSYSRLAGDAGVDTLPATREVRPGTDQGAP